MNQLVPQPSIEELLGVLFKWKSGIIIILVSTMLSAGIWLTLVRDPVYEVTAKILVKTGREQASPPSVLGNPPTTLVQRTQEVNSEVDILMSQTLLGQVIDHFHLDRDIPPPVPTGLVARLRYEVKRAKKVIGDGLDEVLIWAGMRERLDPWQLAMVMLARGFVVVPQKDSNVIVARMLLPFREGSNVVLNKLLEFYLDARRRIFSDDGAVEFFAGQTDKAADELRRAEGELAQFEATWQVSDIDKQRETLLRQIAEARIEVSNAKVALDEAAAKVAKLDRMSGGSDADFAALGEFNRSAFPEAIMLQLAGLKREREQLRLQELNGGLRTENNRGQFTLLWQTLASNLRAVHAERQAAHAARRNNLDRLQAELVALQERQREWVALKRTVAVQEGKYLFQIKKLDEASAGVELADRKIGNVVVIEPAIEPVIPAGMRKLTMLGIALAAGLLASLVWVSLAEFFDHGIYSAEALATHVDAPVIGVIPTLAPRREQ